jgi:hypothetical protein
MLSLLAVATLVGRTKWMETANGLVSKPLRLRPLRQDVV